jgi:hypothetical protein
MEAASSCEKLVTVHETTRCHKSEESNLNFQHHENLKSQMKKCLNDEDAGILFLYPILIIKLRKTGF